MSGTAEDEESDSAWSGRPQDDPRYLAAARKKREAYRAAHPPVNCWIDAVQTIDLYFDGKHRACVLTGKALAHVFDENGNTVAALTYLRSETAFGAVEKYLGIGRVAEVRDDSNEGGGEISALTRDLAENDARAFRAACLPSDEASYYLRDAVKTCEFFGGTVTPPGRKWRSMIDGALSAIAGNDRKAAQDIVLAALAGMDKHAILDWQVAWVDCARAAEALRRDLERAVSA